MKSVSFRLIIVITPLKLISLLVSFPKGSYALIPSQVGQAQDPKVSDVRVSKTAWLWDNTALDKGIDKFKIVPMISKRIELITGLSTQYKELVTDAEPFQLVNYGLGGHYEPHHDYSEEEEEPEIVPEFLKDSGDRMVTFMLYLSDVDEGGATVFPLINVRVPPVKNAAAFWFNLQPSGDGDPRTKHAGCPVLIGEKWVANKWIWSHSQMFRKPCTNELYYN